ncbi:MAG: hypothetical protein AAB907_02435 [Patescibacteria group bacterium]
MKIQDIGFVVLLVILLIRRDPRLFALAGIACLFLSIPLFSLWIFFTAERLTWYAATFFLMSAILHMIRLRK